MRDARLVLILRFRDLVRPEPGFTVREHNTIAAVHGYTWWGWWKKQSEEIPVEVWSRLASQARLTSDGIEALLLDSGQRKLYSARLLGISFEIDGSFAAAPEKDKTPVYYNPPENPTNLATWFKFGPISEESTEQKLLELMYAVTPHDDLVPLAPDELANVRMGGIADLLAFGNITYWIGTLASESSTPARRLNARVIEPIAPKDIIRAESTRILHISDLHLALGKHAFALGEGDAHNMSLSRALFEAVKTTDLLPGLVIVTGDLTWTGSAAEFDNAFRCLDAIRSMLGLQTEHFIVVPGNHDLQWTRKQQDDGEHDFDGKVEMWLPTARANYMAFFLKWYGVPANEYLSIGRRFFLVGGPTLDVLGLNSSALQQVEGQFAGLGRVTETAFDDSARRMGWAERIRATERRIIAVHHHVLPVVAKERASGAPHGFGIALDAGSQIGRATQYGVDLILHGHQHQPHASLIHRQEIVGRPAEKSDGILVLGGGSAGVADPFLGPINQRCFNLIDLGHQAVKLELFSTHTAPDEFRTMTQLEASYGQPWRRK